MNAPFVHVRTTVRLADLRDPDERRAIERFVAAHPQGTPFHLPAWLNAVERGTGNRALALVMERGVAPSAVAGSTLGSVSSQNPSARTRSTIAVSSHTPPNRHPCEGGDPAFSLDGIAPTQEQRGPRLRGGDGLGVGVDDAISTSAPRRAGGAQPGTHEPPAGAITGYLPLNEIHSPIFGRLLASTGFAVDGGLLLADGEDGSDLLAAAERMALRHSCPTIELRGGPVGDDRAGWALRTESHCGFVAPLAADDEAQLTAVPRKQRAEVRKSLANDFQIEVGVTPELRAEHYAVYAESVRNLGTPVFPRALFDAVIDAFGEDVDILTVRHEGRAVASVLSLYWRGAVMPYWGGGTWDARRLRANDRMYYELMLHARRRGCDRFDFGRSKTQSGAYHFKRNWGFTPEPLSYAVWTAPGADTRDADPTSAKHKLQIALWQRLPLPVANAIGPWIARGLG